MSSTNIADSWTEKEYDVLFDGMARSWSCQEIARALQSKTPAQVQEKMESYLQGQSDDAFRSFCQRRGYDHTTTGDKSDNETATESSEGGDDEDDATPPPSEQKRRGGIAATIYRRIHPRPTPPKHVTTSPSRDDEEWNTSDDSSTEEDEGDWNSSKSRRRRPKMKKKKKKTASTNGQSSTIKSQKAKTASGRQPRRCRRCLEYGGENATSALVCRGRMGYFGQAGCQFFTNSGKPMKNPPVVGATPSESKGKRKRISTESLLTLSGPITKKSKTAESRTERKLTPLPTTTGRSPRRCMRCLEFGGGHATECRGRIGTFGKDGCEFFTSTGAPKHYNDCKKKKVASASISKTTSQNHASAAPIHSTRATRLTGGDSHVSASESCHSSTLPSSTSSRKDRAQRRERRDAVLEDGDRGTLQRGVGRHTRGRRTMIADDLPQVHRRFRRCIRCLQYNGSTPEICRGRIGTFGQNGCEFFTATGEKKE